MSEQVGVTKTGVVDWTDMDNPKRNMYGVLPCPVCGTHYRALYKRAGGLMVECDNGHSEPGMIKE